MIPPTTVRENWVSVVGPVKRAVVVFVILTVAPTTAMELEASYETLTSTGVTLLLGILAPATYLIQVVVCCWAKVGVARKDVKPSAPKSKDSVFRVVVKLPSGWGTSRC